MFAFQTKGDALRVCDESVRHDEILGKVFKIEKINSSYLLKTYKYGINLVADD